MDYKQFKNISCYEEFEIQCDLTGISKIDILKEIGHKIDDYYFFVSNDGIFNWFDLEGNHIKDPGMLEELETEYIPYTISECIIPDSVTSIGEGTFSYCRSLESITLPNNVTSICDYAFYNCKSLKDITIPDSVTHIGDIAFSFCRSLTSIILPNNITCIGHEVFSYCYSLKSIIIPNNVTSIRYGAFYYCESLEKIIIPDSVTHIGNGVFSFCESLKEVTFKGKTLDKIKQMICYPFGIKDESIIKCEI